MLGRWHWTIYINQLNISIEVNKFLKENLEELAEVIEALLSVADRLGCSEKELLKVRYNKHIACSNCKQCAYLC